MALTLHLSPELEQRLAEEAARRGQDLESFAVSVLQHHLAESSVEHAEDRQTPEQILADSFARFPPGSPEALARMARRQRVPVFTSLERLAGDARPTDQEFDVDAFLAARREWQWEGRPRSPSSRSPNWLTGPMPDNGVDQPEVAWSDSSWASRCATRIEPCAIVGEQ